MTRKHVKKAIGVTVMASLIVDTLFAVFVTTTCQKVQERVDYDSPQVVYKMCLALFLSVSTIKEAITVTPIAFFTCFLVISK
jgi:hypothetical protein